MTETKTLESAPSLLPQYLRAAIGSMPVISSLPFLGTDRGADVPDVELRLEGVEVDAAHLAAYCRVCGFTLRDAAPPTYPHVLAFPVQMALMNEPRFPFPAVGLVHIGNEITQHRPVGVGERLDLTVSATPLEPHSKGRQFTILTEARVGGELVWNSASTTLRRGNGGEAPKSDQPKRAHDPAELPIQAEWRLPADQGRRYAAVSGDRNPIHMHDLAAKPLGFPKAIAHGMWTKARCLAALEGDLPDALIVEVAFRKPILLPAKVEFASARGRSRRKVKPIEFAVRDARKGTLHLEGSLQPL